jgi:hypothetical protein
MSTATKDTFAAITKIKDDFPILTELPGLCKALEELLPTLNALQEEADVKVSVANYQEATDKRLAQIENKLSQQTDQLFLSDQEHRQMVNHVHAVLDSLEEYLRRHT